MHIHVHICFLLSTMTIFLRGTLHYGRRAKRTSNKLSSRGQGRSPLKYTNRRLCISLKRKVCPLQESLGVHKYCRQVFLHQTNSWRQNSHNVLPCRHFGGYCLLTSNMKAERANFCSPPIKLLKSLVHSTNSHSVKYL
jgi:hypothetical protein